ncbi:cell division protein FtsZ [Desulfonema ishimotonii]|uniref:Cell division protein FtsZ n=1 Tax=Desulfonema ishimotonii TaxID=45657 RepID=A0A401FYF6_9BACT|nr:cell division protein FtsZ [Desulfonema ishimotonii]GBC61990.1 cell division protein FtsZ [Desulfonema ishimotonii]
MFSYAENNEKTARIKVIGVGGAGGNAINNMIDAELRGVDFIVANTDAQALQVSKAPLKIQIGDKITEGLGAGANPQIGKEAALESAEAIRNALKDSHMVFITAGFGGGTGTGAAPVIADICKELGALTVAVLTKPFSFEGRKRTRLADEGLDLIREMADTVISIPNDRLRGLASKNATMLEMFKRADEVLLHSVKGITDLIMVPGHVNLDFADVKTTMEKAGLAIMGIGVANGENRAVEAAERAISHPLLEDLSISGAKAVLMNITSTREITMDEMAEASERIYSEVGDEADIIWGTAIDETLGDELRITVIATGIGLEHGSRARAAGHPEQRRQPINYEPERQIPVRRRPADRDDQRLSSPRPVRRAEQHAEYYEQPTFERMQRKANDSEMDYDDGYEKKNSDVEDLEIPTFLRRKAD